MPRTARVILPEYPHHIVQRGHDRQAVFVTPDDYRYYLATLAEFKAALGVRVYAYCLMTNHVHLLLEPSDEVGIGLLMKRLAGRQTRFRNRLEGRSGTLWEGRYKSSLVDRDAYLFACVRYIELNPLRARIVSDPRDYPWSSCKIRAERSSCSWLDDVPGLKNLIKDEQNYINAYSAFLKEAIPVEEMRLIREAMQRGQLTGQIQFVEQVEAALGRRIEHRGPGRPRKKSVRPGSRRTGPSPER